jgi:hypothetical protein
LEKKEKINEKKGKIRKVVKKRKVILEKKEKINEKKGKLEKQMKNCKKKKM